MNYKWKKREIESVCMNEKDRDRKTKRHTEIKTEEQKKYKIE
jgi:hypothetical protein